MILNKYEKDCRLYLDLQKGEDVKTIWVGESIYTKNHTGDTIK